MRIKWNDYQVQPSDIGRSIAPIGHRVDPRWDGTPTTDHDLWFISGGRGRVRLDGAWTQVAAGSCLWLRPGFRIAPNAEQSPDDPINITFIHFDLIDRRGRVRSARAAWPPQAIETPDVQFIEAAARRLADLAIGFGTGVYERLTGTNLEIGRTILRALLMELDEAGDPSARANTASVDPRHQAIARAATMRILGSLKDPPSVEELAAEFGFSRQHFSRIFKQVTRLTPQAFAIRSRIRRAQQMLQSSDMKIREIADVLGYRDALFFSRQFRQIAGTTPTLVRHGKIRREKSQ